MARLTTRGLRTPDPRHMENFAIYAPLATHHVPTDCERANCPRWRTGFVIALELSDDLTDVRAGTIRRGDRRCAEFLVQAGDVTAVDWRSVGAAEVNTNALGGFTAHRVFVFPPGERCFAAHTEMRDDLDPLFEHSRGMRRVVPGSGGKVIDRREDKRLVDGDEFKERMNQNADALNRARQRG